MFGKHHHYVPVLKWKRAEQTALQNLDASPKGRLTPLLEIVPVPTDLDTGEQTKSLGAHVDPAVQRIVTAWGTDEPFFLDPAMVAADSQNGMDGSAYVFSEAAKAQLKFVPVAGVYRSAPAVAAAVKHSQHGLCLRIDSDDLSRASLATDIAAFVGKVKGDPAAIDVVIDLEAVHGQSAFIVAAAAQAALRSIPNVTAWRTLTVIASAFPEHMGGFAPSSSQLVPRTEWLGWLQLHAQRGGLPRLPTFGDYAIQHPTGAEGFDPRFMQMSANVRYTVKDSWLVLKGVGTKAQALSIQFPNLARHLVKHPSFYGAGHSKGCDEALACAQGSSGFGSAEVWRRIGTSHHLTVAVAELAGLAYP